MNWRRALIAVAVVAIPFTLLLAMSMDNDPRIIRSPLIGEPAPEFALEVLQSGVLVTQPGDTIRLSDHLGEVVVVNFWASWCLPCWQEHPVLLRVASEYEGRGVRFFGVLYKDQPAAASRWLAERGEAYPTGLDDNARVAIEYGVGAIPETYLIGRDGRIAYKHFGAIGYDVLTRHLDALLAEPVPQPAAPSDPPPAGGAAPSTDDQSL